MDIVLVVTAGSAGRVIGDAEIGQGLIVVIRIHVERETPLLEVAETNGAVGPFLRFGQRRQEQRRQDGDDSDDDEQFDQCESSDLSFHVVTLPQLARILLPVGCYLLAVNCAVHSRKEQPRPCSKRIPQMHYRTGGVRADQEGDGFSLRGAPVVYRAA